MNIITVIKTFIIISGAISGTIGLISLIQKKKMELEITKALVVSVNVKEKLGQLQKDVPNKNIIIIEGRLCPFTYTKFCEDLAQINNNEPIDIIIQTIGGELESGLLISIAIAKIKSKTRCIIPSFAFSGGTVLIFSCNEIYAKKNAIFSPIDSQVINSSCGYVYETYSVNTYIKALDKIRWNISHKKAMEAITMIKQDNVKRLSILHHMRINNHCKSIDGFNVEETILKLYDFLDGTYIHECGISVTSLTKRGLKINPFPNEYIDIFKDEKGFIEIGNSVRQQFKI